MNKFVLILITLITIQTGIAKHICFDCETTQVDELHAKVESDSCHHESNNSEQDNQTEDPLHCSKCWTQCHSSVNLISKQLHSVNFYFENQNFYYPNLKEISYQVVNFRPPNLIS
jgi:hypothetical protein